MSVSEIVEQIRALTPEERREVVERIGIDFLEFDPELSSEKVAELDRRAEAALEHPERGRPASEVFNDVNQNLRGGK